MAKIIILLLVLLLGSCSGWQDKNDPPQTKANTLPAVIEERKENDNR